MSPAHRRRSRPSWRRGATWTTGALAGAAEPAAAGAGDLGETGLAHHGGTHLHRGAAGPTGMSAQGVEVAHGVTLRDIHVAALRAVDAAHTRGANHVHRYETAWSAIAEHVWTAGETPPFRDLVAAGIHAVDAEMRREPHHHGYARADGGGGLMKAASVYWWDHCAEAGSGEPRDRWWGQSARIPSPENAIVERLALAQILPALTPGQRDALNALATHGTHAEAAGMLGIAPAAFRQRVRIGRDRFFALWHEGESAPALWRVDRRTPEPKRRRNLRSASGRRSLPPCGTATRYGNHGCRCVECCTAYTVQAKARRRRRGVGPPRPGVTVSQLAEIRADYEAGFSVAWLARKHRRSHRTVSQLLRGDRLPVPDTEAAS